MFRKNRNSTIILRSLFRASPHVRIESPPESPDSLLAVAGRRQFFSISRDKPLKRLKTAKLQFGIIWRRCAPEPPFSRQQGKGGLRGLTAIRVRQLCDQLAF